MNGNDTPLDRTTARVVNELASRIVPELTQALDASEAERRLTLTNSLMAAFDELSALKELCGGLARSIETSKANSHPALPTGITEALSRIEARIEGRLSSLDRLEKLARENVEEGRVGRQVLLQPLGAVVDELSALRAQAGPLSEAVKGSVKARDEALQKLQEGVDRLTEGCREAIARQSDLAREIEALEEWLRAKTQAPGPTSAAPTAPAAAQLLQTAIPSWEGVLKAHAQSQTQELDSLSRELGNLQRQTHATLLQNLQDSIAQELAARDEEWEERLRAEREAMDRALAPFRRVLWLLAGMGLLSLILSIARFLR